MKKFMKKLAKKTEGFTLVELIVVIAILGILAGIAVPAYSGYLKEANQTADDTQIAVMNTAIGSACALKGKTTADITKCTISSKAITALEAGSIDLTSDYTALYSGNALDLKFYTDIEWDDTNNVIKGK